MDRIELGTQSLAEYKSFADDDECVQGTENTAVLRKRLLEDSYQNTLIVTSIQKMSRIHAEDGGMNAADLEKMRAKRIVFIIDECHRSTFGDMLRTIKETFPDALFFGFTGTPIHEENAKKMSTTSDVFGDELHRYSIADGIRDGNVLGFDPYMVCTFKRSDVRREVALSKAHAQDEDEALSDPQKKGIFYHFLNAVPMAGETDERGTYQRGIEDFVPHSQYAQDEHRRKVIEDMCDGWMSRSNKGMFHGLFATSSIPEAIAYYRLFKEMAPQFKVTALFDPSIDNNGGAAIAKQDGLLEIIKDYNRMYGQNFELATYAAMKADIAARMAHKNTYRDIENKPEKRIDILIVVDQMLTGFDSKWINVLYLDKVIDYALLIQAFSRTNRLFNENLKPFGMIRYYRRPYTMKRNIDQAVKVYSGDRPFALFADKLPANIKMLNALYGQIEEVFKQGGAEGFATLPNEDAHKAKFASLFNEFNEYLNAAKVQGFSWDTLEYRVEDAFDALDASGGVAGAQDGPSLGVAMGASEGESSDEPGVVRVVFDEHAYGALLQRYKELAKPPVPTPPNGDPPQEAPFDLKGYLTEIDTGRIDAAYMNANFEKWLKAVGQPDVSQAELDRLMADLHRSFASLSQEDQRYAELFLDDIQAGDIRVQPGKTFTDYIAMYAADAYNDRVSTVVEALGVDKEMLIHLLTFTITESNINEFGRFDTLLETVDKNRAKAYFEETEGVKCPTYKVNMKVDKALACISGFGRYGVVGPESLSFASHVRA